MTREKHVFDTDEIAHLWANQSQAGARNPQGNFYFRGKVLYSYRDSWEVAKLLTNDKSESAVAINSDTYSVTTATHTHMARSATRHMLQFTIPLKYYMPNDADAETCFRDWYQVSIGKLLAKASRARENKPYLVNEANNLKDEANTFAKFFGLRSRIKSDATMGKLMKEATEQDKRNREKAREANRVRAIENARREQYAEGALMAWILGDDIDTYEIRGGYTDPCYLRIKADNVETSMGVKAPVKHAAILYRFILKLKADGKSWQSNGHTFHIGHYTVSRIDDNGDLHAGCHFIQWSEVERIGQQLVTV